jgi:hypothetical protein
MARLRRDARLETREARTRLPLDADRNGYSRTVERGSPLFITRVRRGALGSSANAKVDDT